MYTKVFLRLEPLGLELVAESLRRAGHDIRLMDLQVESHDDFFRELDAWRPDAICFSLNYLANVPEVVDLAKAAKTRLPECFTFVGGHSASFVAIDAKSLYVHRNLGRKGRALDDATEQFVDEGRMGVA